MQFTIDEYKDKFPGVVRSRRRAREISQRALAEKAGVSEKTIVDIEKKNFNSLTLTTVQKVCKALDIKAVFVLSD